MPQFGAKALAEDGKTAQQIVTYFYTGTSIGQVGQGNLIGHAEPLRIGAAQDVTTSTFGAVGGQLSLCIDGVCALTAQPADGNVWSFRSIGLEQCQYFKGGAPVGATGACRGEIKWTNQPNIRVTFPGLNRTYARGRIVFADAPGNAFHLTVEVPLEEYLYGLGEMPSSWHNEALGAQAIAGRTYALWRAWVYRDLANHSTRMEDCACHLYASTKDQKYIGWAKEAEGTGGHWGDKWRAAVNATAGKAIIHSASGNRAIQAFFFSSSGGATENNEDVWGGIPFSYLRSVTDPGFSSWTETFSSQAFAAALGFDQVVSAVITGTNVSGSPSGILIKGVVEGATVSKSYTGGDLRSKLGLRSHYIKALKGFLPGFVDFLGGDFDDDGKDEVAAFSAQDGTWWVFNKEGGTLIGSKWAAFSTASGWSARLGGDFNGDGKSDTAQFHPSNGTWWVSRSTGSSFSTEKWADFSTASGWGPQLVGDFNGDGRDDVANYHSSNGTWWVSRSTGSGFATSLWADFSTAKGWKTHLVGDFDGDGRDDIASYHPSNGTWWVSRSTGSGFATSLWADFSTASGWSSHLVGDFNDDGRDDIANFHPSNGTWWVSRSTGSRFSTALWADFTTTRGWSPQIVGDFNGDGRHDIANFYSGNGTWWVSQSTGASFGTYLRGSVSSGTNWQGQLAVDLDGNGSDELSNWSPATLTWTIK
jgi:SpoIID/LytB domain protein